MDTELGKDFSERDAALMREEINSKFHESEAALEKLISENERLNIVLDEKIKSIKSDVSEVAIDKTLSILSHVRSWVVIIGVFITFFAFCFGILGIKNIDQNLASHFETKVERWLRFEPEDGPAKAKLDEIRTKAILDAYTIKLSRSKSDPYGIHSVELNTLEQERLLEVLLDSKTSYSDFIDALRLITASRGIFGLWRPEDDIGKTVANMLQDEAYSPSKKGQILSYMRNDQSLLPHTKDIIAYPSNSNSVKSQAFRNIALFDEEYATSYANENLMELPNSQFKSDLAEHLAKTSPESRQLIYYMKALKTERKVDWQSHLLAVVQAMIESSATSEPSSFDLIVKELSFLINNGTEITLSDSSFGPRYLTFSLATNGSTYYSALREPIRLLSNKALLNSIIKLKPDSLDWLTKVIKPFEIEEFGFYFTTLLVKLGEGTYVNLANDQVVTQSDIEGKGWLRMEQIADDEFPVFIWRDRTGRISQGVLISIENATESKYELSFDSEIVNNLSARKLNNEMWSW